MITRYSFMKTQVQENGVEYPDCLSLDLNIFSYKDPTEQVQTTETSFYRPDLFFFNIKQNNNLEDIVLWLNQIPSKRNMLPGTDINVPSENDLNRYYLANRI